jgi:hypothetical protein
MVRLPFFIRGSQGQKKLFVPLFLLSEETFELSCSVTSRSVVDVSNWPLFASYTSVEAFCDL